MSNDELWTSLRGKGYDLGDIYLRAGVCPAGGRVLVVIDGVAMSFDAARMLDRGQMTLEQSGHCTKQ